MANMVLYHGSLGLFTLSSHSSVSDTIHTSSNLDWRDSVPNDHGATISQIAQCQIISVHIPSPCHVQASFHTLVGRCCAMMPPRCDPPRATSRSTTPRRKSANERQYPGSRSSLCPGVNGFQRQKPSECLKVGPWSLEALIHPQNPPDPTSAQLLMDYKVTG